MCTECVIPILEAIVPAAFAVIVFYLILRK